MIAVIRYKNNENWPWGFQKRRVFKYFTVVKINKKSQMTSSCLTFDLRYDLNIQCIQSLITVHTHVQISGLYYELNKSYAFLNVLG